MAILILKALHFAGYIIWFAGLFYVVSHILKIYFLKSDVSKEPIRHYLVESALDAYRKIANPAMMFTWTAGLIMLYLYGTEWFRINLWIHQKIALLILLTVYHVYCKILLRRVKDRYDGFCRRLYPDFQLHDNRISRDSSSSLLYSEH
jgi:protoporphyrinogen IX oxidase